MYKSVHLQLHPTPVDAAIAQSAHEALSSCGSKGQPLALRVRHSEQDQPVHSPGRSVDLLMQVLKTLATGGALR